MNNRTKNLWVKYFKCRHANWLIEFNKQLSIGACTDKLINQNILIGYLIKTFCHYNGNSVKNCLTFEEMCTIKNKIINLTGKCSGCK